MNDARRQIDRMLAAGRPMAEIEERIEQLPIGDEAEAPPFGSVPAGGRGDCERLRRAGGIASLLDRSG